MASKLIDSIRRTGNSSSSIRQLVVVQGEGKAAVETVLSTPITKISWGMKYQGGKSAKPVEQYAFVVGAKTVERFSDAAALVLKKHNVKFSTPTEDLQTYVKEALAKLEDTSLIKILAEVPADAVPAQVAA